MNSIIIFNKNLIKIKIFLLKKYFYYILIVGTILIIPSCTSNKGKKKVKNTLSSLTEKPNKAQVITFVKKKSYHEFFNLINQNKQSQPKEINQAINEYLLEQKQFFYHFFNKKDYTNSLFYLNNLLVSKQKYIRETINRYNKIVTDSDEELLLPFNPNSHNKSISINRPWIGFLVNFTSKKKLEIDYVFPFSTIYNQGIYQGDLLIKINHIPIDSLKKANHIINNLQAGNVILLEFQSKLKKKNYYLILNKRPPSPLYTVLIKNPTTPKIETLYPFFGITLKAIKKKYTFEKKKIKLFTVTKIKKTSPLYKKGVKKKDLLGIIENKIKDKQNLLKVIHLPIKEFDKKGFDKKKQKKDYIYEFKAFSDNEFIL